MLFFQKRLNFVLGIPTLCLGHFLKRVDMVNFWNLVILLFTYFLVHGPAIG